MDPDLNNSLGNVAIDKDRYTDKRLIIKVSLTEVMFIRRKGSFRCDGPNDTKGVEWCHPETRGAGCGTATYARVDRTKTGDT